MKNGKNIVTTGVSVLLIWLCSGGAIAGQVSYANRKLAWIGSRLPASCLPERDTCFVCPSAIEGKSILVKYGKPHQITHAGISLFSDNAKMNIHETACNFLERFLLELALLPDKKSIQAKLKEYKINIRLNGVPYGTEGFNALIPALNRIGLETPFTLKKEPALFTGIWHIDDANALTVSFPAERELITGYNKREADEQVHASLAGYSRQKETCRSDILPDSGVIFDSEALIYMERQNFFMDKAIHNHVYYRRQSDHKYYLLNDIDQPAETISNLLLGYTSFWNPMIRLTHIYNNSQSVINIPLADFICLFKHEFEPFCSVRQEGEEKDALKITLILHHKEFNYIHMLSAETSTGNIFGENGIDADFYSTISQYNLDNNKFNK
jgi:hypothetical protein